MGCEVNGIVKAPYRSDRRWTDYRLAVGEPVAGRCLRTVGPLRGIKDDRRVCFPACSLPQPALRTASSAKDGIRLRRARLCRDDADLDDARQREVRYDSDSADSGTEGAVSGE